MKLKNSVLLCISLLLFNFMSCVPGKINYVEKLKITTKLAFIIDGKLKEVEDSFCVYQYRGKKIFEFNYHETLENLDSILMDEVRYYYFTYNAKTNTGYIFKDLSDSGLSKNCNADSMIKEKVLKPIVYSVVVTNGRLIRKMEGPEKNQITYVYIPLQKPDASYNDTSYLTFSDELKDVNYSFSKSADSAFKSKLVQGKFLFNAFKLENSSIPKRENSVKMEKIKATNSKNIIRFMERNRKFIEN